MKKILLAILIALSCTFSSFGAGNPYFKEVANLPYVTYVYISPAMLATMGDRAINTKSMSISAKELSSAETIRTVRGDETQQKIMDIIKKVIKKEKLETLATKTGVRGTASYTLMGRLQKGGKELSCLLVIERTQQGYLYITYLTGKIKIQGKDLGGDFALNPSIAIYPADCSLSFSEEYELPEELLILSDSDFPEFGNFK